MYAHDAGTTATSPCTCPGLHSKYSVHSGSPTAAQLRRARTSKAHPKFPLEGSRVWPRESREQPRQGKAKKRPWWGRRCLSKVSRASFCRTDLHEYGYSFVPTRWAINNGSHLSTNNVFVCKHLSLAPWEMGLEMGIQTFTLSQATAPIRGPAHFLCGGRCTLGARSAPASTEYAGGWL